MRSLIDLVGQNKGALSLQAEICADAIAWAEAGKRTFLKQRIQTRLAAVYVSMGKYTQSLALITKLTREVKKFDDKLLQVEIFLIESRAHLELENLPKVSTAHRCVPPRPPGDRRSPSLAVPLSSSHRARAH